MKKIKCKACTGIWIVEQKDLERQRVCPYCEKSIRSVVEFTEYDSLDKAIYGAITKMGKGILNNQRQLSAFMMDTAPEIKKEVRIFLKTVTDDYMNQISKAFDQELDEAKSTVDKLKRMFIDEEGLSDSWADMLCRGIYGAILYTKGIGTTKIIDVEVVEFVPANQNVSKVEKEQQQTGMPKSAEDLKNRKESSVKQYHDEEFEKCRQLAERGDAAAQNHLGEMYQYGKGVKRDDEEAVKWYRKSAEQGDTAGQNNLGWMYQYGLGVKKDDKEAVKWYQKAAEQGNAAAQNHLGKMYLKTDYEEAIKWYRKAAEQGNAEGQNNLGWMYEWGKGVKQDYAEAEKWYRKAAEQGNVTARINLLRLKR